MLVTPSIGSGSWIPSPFVRSGNCVQIIDGEHRWKIALERHLDLIPAFDLGVVEDAVAQQLTIVLNETRGQANPAKLGALLTSVMAKETKESLLSTLPYTRRRSTGSRAYPQP